MNLPEGFETLQDPVNFKTYLKLMSYFYNYSWRNNLLIYNQMPTATKLEEYKNWKDYKRTIKQGSKTIYILTPVEQPPTRKLVEKTDPDTGEAMYDASGKRIMEELIIERPPKFDTHRLLDISQTEGAPVMRFTGDILSCETLYGAFFDVLGMPQPEGVVSTQAIFETILTIVKLKCRNIQAQAEAIKQLMLNSIAYVVSCRFGAIGEFDASIVAESQLEQLTGVVATIHNEAANLISNTIESLEIICHKKKISGMTAFAVLEPTAVTSSHSETELNATPHADTPTTEPESAHINNAPPNTVATSSHDETELESPPPDTRLPHEIDVYTLSAKQAAQYGHTDIYNVSTKINIACCADIDQEIQASRIGPGKYDLKASATKLRNLYGENRLRWLLSVFIIKNAKSFSQDSISWATEILNCDEHGKDATDSYILPEEDLPFNISTSKPVLNVFIKRLQSEFDRKISFKERMAMAAKKVKAQNMNP